MEQVLFIKIKLIGRFLTDLLASNKLFMEVGLNKFKSCEEQINLGGEPFCDKYCFLFSIRSVDKNFAE